MAVERNPDRCLIEPNTLLLEQQLHFKRVLIRFHRRIQQEPAIGLIHVVRARIHDPLLAFSAKKQKRRLLKCTTTLNAMDYIATKEFLPPRPAEFSHH